MVLTILTILALLPGKLEAITLEASVSWSCPDGLFLSDIDECVTCPFCTECTEPTSESASTSCKECVYDAFLVSPGVCACSPGFYPSDNRCNKCPPLCIACTSENSCSSCVVDANNLNGGVCTCDEHFVMDLFGIYCYVSDYSFLQIQSTGE